VTTLRQLIVSALAAALAVTGVLPAGHAAAPVTASASAAPGSWAVQPGGNASSAARGSFVYTLRPGAVLRDTVRVINTGRKKVTVDLYAADAYMVGKGGAFTIRQRDEKRVGVGKWVKLGSKKRRTIRPGRALDIPFLVKVPRNAQPGDHAGAILAAGVKLQKSRKGSLGVDVRRRIGTRIYLRVEGPMRPSMSVKELEATGKPALFPFVGGNGETTVTYEITNPGNVRITPEARLELRGPFGNLVDSIPVDVPELLPGATITQTAQIDKLPPLGRLSAKLVLTSAEVNATASAGIWSVPWAPGLLLLLLVGGFVLRKKLKPQPKRRAHGRRAAA